MILHLSCQSFGIDLRLPAADADVKRTLSTLRDGLEPTAPVRISGVCGNAYSLHRYIQYANLENEGDLRKLNRLAELFDGIDVFLSECIRAFLRLGQSSVFIGGSASFVYGFL